MVVPAPLAGDVDAVTRDGAWSPRLLALLAAGLEARAAEGAATTVRLRTSGRTHRLDVRQLGPLHFHVRSEIGTVDIDVVRTGAAGRRLTFGATTIEVDIDSEPDGWRVHVGGRTYHVEQVHNTVVDAPHPGVLVGYACRSGDEVNAGDPLATLEAMKLLTTVRAPSAGRVGTLLAVPQWPVERGAPLVELHALDGGDLEVPVAEDDGRFGTTGCLLNDLRACLLGYDIDTDDLVERFRHYPAGVIADGRLVDREAELLQVVGTWTAPDRTTRVAGPLTAVLERWLRLDVRGSEAAALRSILAHPRTSPGGWDVPSSRLIAAVRARLDEPPTGEVPAMVDRDGDDLAGFVTAELDRDMTCRIVLATTEDDPRDRRLVAFVAVDDLEPRATEALVRRLAGAIARLRSIVAATGHGGALAVERIVVRGTAALSSVAPREWRRVVREVADGAAGLDLEAIEVRWPDGDGGERTVVLAPVAQHAVAVHPPVEAGAVLAPAGAQRRAIARCRGFGTVHPWEVLRLLTPPADALSDLPPGSFQEYDLDEHGRLVRVHRPPGSNTANVVVGVIGNRTAKHPEGLWRVVVLGDPTRDLGSLAEPECRRIIAALDLADGLRVPLEWFAVSSGALISMDSGTECMDWIAAVMRRLVEFTQAGGEVNIVVVGLNVGGQPYWNAEATMLMHTRGILVMTPGCALVLTGKAALDYSGGVSADDNDGIGGVDRIMGPNGQAQYRAETLEEACDILFRHYEHTYVGSFERFPRRAVTTDPVGRDVRDHPLAATDGGLERVGDIFSHARNHDRKAAFDIRSVMRAVSDLDLEPLERWPTWHDAATAVVWDAHLGGIPVCLIGVEGRHVARDGDVPPDGPSAWTSGTLFPASAKKIARAVNAASGNRPVVVLANLAGFDGSPESLRSWQLEYGAEIGRAITNFDGPIVICVLSRYHGGAFVVFSKRLNPAVEVAAVDGAYASVIGGTPAAAVVFGREVTKRVEADPRIAAARDAAAGAHGADAVRARAAALARSRAAVRGEKLVEVAEEYDRTHDARRALRVGSIDRIIRPELIRPYLVDAVERGMARTLGVSSPRPAQGGTIAPASAATTAPSRGGRDT